MIVQSWRDVAFLHWPHDPDAVRPLVPASLDLDTFRGKAWISVITLRIPNMRAAGLPPVPGLSSAEEAHVRTYVRDPEGRRGVWLLSVDADPLPAALAGRGIFFLPYWWARMSVATRDSEIRYEVRRRAWKPGRLELVVELGPPRRAAELRQLDHFLTARWAIHLGLGPVGATALVQHPRWKFRRATVVRLAEDLTPSLGLPPPDVEPVVHFSDGVDTRIGIPRPFLSPRG
jgi:uncharacterized protein YqjF (DUF2071 family)